jgi:RES domain-containing protein
MIVYRLSKLEYAKDLSGRGAELHGGRWNSKGEPIVYTSQSRALAFVELAAHIPVGILPKDYYLVSINIPDKLSLLQLNSRDLPAGWRSIPHSNGTQQLGDRFIADGDYAVLQVPSAIVPGDFNFLINPKHPEARHLTIKGTEPFEFDSRFVRRKS